jgi:hypothetical protein
MASSEERMRILKMVQEGKINAEDGIRLIEALGKQRPVEPPRPTPPGGVGRFFHIRVTDTRTEKVRVNVRLPVNLVNAGLKMGAHLTPEMEGLDAQQLMEAINSGETGKIVDVYHAEEGERVEVMIE